MQGPWPIPNWAPPPMEAPQPNWVQLIEVMYQRFNPTKLPELEDILVKYRGREAELYRALCEKYGAPTEWMTQPPQMQPPPFQQIPQQELPRRPVHPVPLQQQQLQPPPPWQLQQFPQQ